MTDAVGLVKYDAMCNAIAECRSVDEVKELRNKARAMEVYAAQAMNTEAERQCCEIRIRAERRVGQMLKEMKQNGHRQKPGSYDRQKQSSSDTTIVPATKLADLSITKDQSSKWQALADIPDDEFERRVTNHVVRPTTEGIIYASQPKDGSPPMQMDEQALWFWGCLCDFEEGGILNTSFAAKLELMTKPMRRDCERIAPRLKAWLS